jgi:hypothetical protein
MPQPAFARPLRLGPCRADTQSTAYRMSSRQTTTALLLALLLCLPDAAAAGARASTKRPDRQVRSSSERVRVFLDCVRTWCDFDYLRTEIAFVDWVRVREEADVHVLVTTQRTGSGGTQFTLRYIGQDRFEGLGLELTTTTPQTATSDEVRRDFGRVLALGLVRYVATTPDGVHLKVVDEAPPKPATSGVTAEVQRDPWNYWVFRTRLSGQFDGESSVSSSAVNGVLQANRVTEAWKFSFSVDGRYGQSRFEFDDGTEPYTSVQRNWAVRGLGVKSLTERWSAGLRTSATGSTYLNQRLVARVAPALEYNIFPYAESTRRRLTVQYAAGIRYAEYYQPTVYDRLEETRWDHSLVTELDLKQPWGTLNSGVDFTQYFFDLSKYRVGFNNEFDIRLFRGLSANLNSNVQLISNQIYLPAGEATSEEILVRQRQLATSYGYYLSLGVSYTFGSIFNNVVNRRFGG